MQIPDDWAFTDHVTGLSFRVYASPDGEGENCLEITNYLGESRGFFFNAKTGHFSGTETPLVPRHMAANLARKRNAQRATRRRKQ